MGDWQYVWAMMRPHRRRVALSMAAALGIMLVDLGSPLVVAVLIDVIVGQGRYELVVPVMLLFLALPFCAAAMQVTSTWLMTRVGQRLVFDLRRDLYLHVQRLSFRYLTGTTTGKLMERLRGDVAMIQQLLTNRTPALAVQTLTGLMMVSIMFWMSTRVTTLVLVAIVLYVLNYRWFVRRIRAVQRRYRYKMDRLSGMAQERLTAHVVVKSFGAEREEARRFLRANFLAERVNHRFRMLNITYGVTSSAIAWGTYLMVTVVGTYYAIYGQITYGAVTAMSAFTLRLLQPAIELAQLSNQLQQARVALSRISELRNADPDVLGSGGQRLDQLHGHVKFDNVTFAYNPGTPVLRNLSFSVAPGTVVALVGHTGCGKTTLSSLIYRYYDVTEGAILIDGHDIRSLDPRWYRQHLALVPQDPIIHDSTIADNVAYGRRGLTPQQIEHALRQSELGPLIDSLPNGIYTSLADHDGVKLSVGEKQRLCIARAMVAEPSILILDEATSSLDPPSEAKIQLALKRVMAGRTCFVIAHRLSTIMEADVILVMEEGRLLEMGNHARLMSKDDGHYRNLVLTQLANHKMTDPELLTA